MTYLSTDFAAARVIVIRDVTCSRAAIISDIGTCRYTDPSGERHTGMRAVAAAAGVNASTVSRRLAAGGRLAHDQTGTDIEAALVALLPCGPSAYRIPSAPSSPPPAGGYGPVDSSPHPRGGSTSPKAPAPQQAAQAPQQAAPSYPTPQEAAPAPKAPEPVVTPLEALDAAGLAARIAKPLADARRAIADGSLDSVCGLRKATLVMRILGALEREGWSRRDALSAAYYSAVVAKEPSDLRLHVVEPFVSEFGFDPALPKLDAVVPDPERPGQFLHPVVPFLVALMRHGIHVWLYGEAGVGKSRAARDAARLLSRSATVFACHKNTHVDDALGGKELREGSTVDRLGPWPATMQAGGVLVLEEPSKAHPGVLAVAHSMLEEGEVMLPTAEGDDALVKAAPGFVTVAADNSEAGRDPGRYVAVNAMDPAFLDRFAMVQVEGLPAETEIAIMIAAYEAATAPQSNEEN